MSTHEDKGEEAQQRAQPAADLDDAAAGEPFEQGEQPQITLDRYLSRRQTSPRMGWPQILSMLAMLVALLMIVFYKDRCGGMVGRLMNQVAPGEQADTPRSPPVRYRLDE